MRTVRLIVEVPNIPDTLTDDVVREWLNDQIDHPYDAAFEAGVRVTLADRPVPLANPERIGNGTMAYDDTYEAGD